MQRFYLPTSHLGNTELILQDEEIIYQLSKVLRSKTWDEVIFYDWEKNIDFTYKISVIEKRSIIFQFQKQIQKSSENLNLVLFQSLPNKIDKIEEIIQKWTEVWYSEFNFFRAERSQDLRLSPNKLERFEKIIKEASEQSGRNIIPKLIFLEKLDFEKISWEKLFFHTDVKKSQKLSELNIDTNQNINIFVWPEWWFSSRENEIFEKNNFKKVYLWNNILRTENAPVVVGFSILQRFL